MTVNYILDVKKSAVRDGRIDVHQLTFAGARTSFEDTRARVRQVEEARWALEVHRSSQPRDASIDFAQRLLTSLDRSLEVP